MRAGSTGHIYVRVSGVSLDDRTSEPVRPSNPPHIECQREGGHVPNGIAIDVSNKVYSSSSCPLFLFPEAAFVPGPQCEVGFCWYRTSFTRAEDVTDSGCLVKSVLPFAGFASKADAGELGATLSIRTGWILIQLRKISCMSSRAAVVLRDPAHAWERETLKPEFSKPELQSSQ